MTNCRRVLAGSKSSYGITTTTGFFAWAAHLKSNGVRTAMLSNLPRSLGEALLATPGLLDPFDHLTLSYGLKSSSLKPASIMTPRTVSDVAPAEALFLDDKPENVEGARAIGMQAEALHHLGSLSCRSAPSATSFPLHACYNRGRSTFLAR